MKNVIESFDVKKKDMSQTMMGIQNQKAMLHDEISMLKSQLCQIKDKCADEMGQKRALEGIISQVSLFFSAN